MQRANLVICRLNLSKIRQLLNSFQMGQFIIFQIYGLKHSKLGDFDRKLWKS